MGVRASESSLKVTKAVFEARYDEGYRYLDRCGETLVRIRKHDRSWVVSAATPQGTALTNPEKKLILNFGNEKVDMAFIEEGLDWLTAERRARALGEEAEKLYSVIVGTLDVPSTSRVGVRYWVSALADSLEEADRFLCRGAQSALATQVLAVAGAELRDAFLSYVTDDPESGYRRRVGFSTALTLPIGAPAPTGLEGGPGAACVVIDIDTFTRPAEGHFPKVNIFIQEACLQCRRMTGRLFDWLRDQQR